jgi:hypothetical protein
MGRAAFAILLLCLIPMAQVAAETNLSPSAISGFNLAEEVVIARNDLLSELLGQDPQAVRKIMNAIGEMKKQAAPDPQPNTKYRNVLRDQSGKEELPIDPHRNPDLNLYLQRASPEAAYDLFQILKRVGAGTRPAIPR